MADCTWRSPPRMFEMSSPPRLVCRKDWRKVLPPPAIGEHGCTSTSWTAIAMPASAAGDKRSCFEGAARADTRGPLEAVSNERDRT